MSRTYRKHIEHYTHAHGEIYHWREWFEMGHRGIYGSYQWINRVDKKCRDEKPWGKPPKWFKQMKRRHERAQVQNVMRHEDYENIPHFKTSDGWDWT